MARKLALVVSLLALSGAGCTPSVPTDGRADRGGPNILVIVTDDQRADGTLGVMTETREWFEEGGTRFTRAFATTPLCCPARASIFTGRYAHNHGVRLNSDAGALDHRSTIQRYLQQAGYETAIVGKFLNEWDVAEPPPFFDRWAISEPMRYRDSTFNVDGRLETVKEYSTDYVAGQAERLIEDFEDDDGRPWFLYVAPLAPHLPLQPRRKYANTAVGKWDGNPAVLEQDRSDKPPYVREGAESLEEGRRVRKGQLRLLLSVDDLVGRIFETLEEEDEGDTLAFFVGDNGFLWSEHGLTRKNAPYTGSIGVPFLIRWPGHVEAGALDHRLVGNVDIVPTILEATRIAAHRVRPVDGRSLLGRDERNRVLTEGWAAKGIPQWASIRTARYQYIEYYAEDGATVTFREYYDLVADPWQLENLLAEGATGRLRKDLLGLETRLARDRRCVGRHGRRPCP